MVAPSRTRRRPPATSRPTWHRLEPHSNRPCRPRLGPASWGASPMSTVRHQRNGSTPQPGFRTLQGTPNSSNPTGPQPPCSRCVGRPHPRTPRHCAQNRGRNPTRHQTALQHCAPLQHSNAKRHRRPQHGPRPLLPPSHAGALPHHHIHLHHLLWPPATTTPPAAGMEASTTLHPDPTQKAHPPRAPSRQQHRLPRSPQTSRGTTPKQPTPTH